VRRFLKLAHHEDNPVSNDDVKRYAAALDKDNGWAAFQTAASQLAGHDFDTLSLGYPSITAPTLLVWGEDDEIVPLGDGRRLKNELTRTSAKLLELKKCGHIPHEEKPSEAVPTIVGFLT
jgi:pimeloyl-ACP methyl ester carboxylesterase